MRTSNPDTIPTPNDPSGICPRCSRTSNFRSVNKSQQLRSYLRDGSHYFERVDVLSCYGCQESLLVVTENSFEGDQNILHVFPAPGAGSLDDSVDKDVASAFDEGMRCLSIGANRAAAVMFRSALSLFIKDKGSDSAKAERHLKTALNQMKTDGALHPSLWDWADHLNQIGNEGAHPEEYDDVTEQEALGLSKFLKNLINIEYEMPARLVRDRGAI